MRKLAVFAFVFIAFIFPGCGNKNEPAPPTPAPPAPPAPPPPVPSGYRVIHVEHGGDLAVEVYYKKNVRKRKIDTSKDAKCPELLDESILVNSEKLLKDVVVHLDIHEGKEPERRVPPTFDQNG